MKEKKILTCKIIKVEHCFSSPNLTYEVYDGDKVVSTGVSSSEDWVKHDAGGYHTKEKFDKLYPQGWEVKFNF